MKNGSFLYIMGLQAGTEYSLNITLTSIFGTVWSPLQSGLSLVN